MRSQGDLSAARQLVVSNATEAATAVTRRLVDSSFKAHVPGFILISIVSFDRLDARTFDVPLAPAAFLFPFPRCSR
jgi:hypothetical protein